jgi:hypothetical protein
MVWIAEEVGILKAPLTNEPFRVDSQPATFSKVENVAVVDIAVQHTDVLRACQQPARRHG